MRIALVEDDSTQAELLSSWVKGANHECYCFENGKDFVRTLARESFDLTILDWELPDIDGLAVLTRIREQIEWPMPVLFITSRGGENDIVSALEKGADDYITKPPRHAETMARLSALLRRALPQEANEILEFPPYRFDTSQRIAYVGEESVTFTQKEFELALFLFRNVGRLLSRGHILESVWATRPDLNTRTIDTHVSRVRQKLKLGPANGWKLSSVYQHGYRLEQLEPEQA